MKKVRLLIAFLFTIGLSLSTLAQDVIIPPKENAHEADSGKVFESSEINPSFPGGMQAQMTFLANNIVYPEVAKENGIQGTVFVSFIVEKDGRLTHIRILRGVSPEIDKEVIRVVKKMPRWEAGTNKGEPVRARLNMPVKFSLQTDIIPEDDIIIVGGEDIDMEPAEEGGNNSEDEIFIFVEDFASYPGGDDARMKYLRENLKYPKRAIESGIEGIVYLKFVVEKDGSITNVKVIRGIGGGCDEEAIRVVKNMPKWKPAKQRGKLVRVQFNMPIKFVLSGGETKKLSKKEQKKLDRQKRKAERKKKR